MKSKADKKVNRIARQLNKSIAADVFGNRFWVRQAQKAKVDGINYYLYELRDRLQPERNKLLQWDNEFAFTTFHNLALAMNDFIISSNFWENYKKGE